MRRPFGLRVKLVALLVGLLFAGLGLQVAGSLTALEANLIAKVDADLDLVGARLGEHVATQPAERPIPAEWSLEVGMSGIAVVPYVEVRGPEGRPVTMLTSAAGRPPLPAGWTAGPVVEHATVPDPRRLDAGSWRVRVAPLPGGNTLILARPLNEVDTTLSEAARNSAAAGLVVLTGLSLLGWWLVGRGLRPLRRIGVQARLVGAGALDRRVSPADERTEVGRLGTALNTMLARLESAFRDKDRSEQRLRRFVADAAHELRTPLTSLRGYTEVFRRTGLSAEDLALAMRRIEEESARTSTLVDELLLLAHLDSAPVLATAPVDLAALARDAVADARAAAPSGPLRYLGPDALVVPGDAGRLRQVFANLLANVDQHTPPDTPAVVRLSAVDGGALIEVADSGPGLTAEGRARAYERFWRADPSRARASGGAGLGLSIVAAIVAAHAGSVGVAERQGGGAVFRVWLP